MDDDLSNMKQEALDLGLQDSDGNAISMWWQHVKLWEEIELVHACRMVWTMECEDRWSRLLSTHERLPCWPKRHLLLVWQITKVK